MGGVVLQSGAPPPQVETAPRANVGWHVWCSAPTAPGFQPGSVTLAYVNMQRRGAAVHTSAALVWLFS